MSAVRWRQLARILLPSEPSLAAPWPPPLTRRTASLLLPSCRGMEEARNRAHHSPWIVTTSLRRPPRSRCSHSHTPCTRGGTASASAFTTHATGSGEVCGPACPEGGRPAVGRLVPPPGLAAPGTPGGPCTPSESAFACLPGAHVQPAIGDWDGDTAGGMVTLHTDTPGAAGGRRGGRSGQPQARRPQAAAPSTHVVCSRQACRPAAELTKHFGQRALRAARATGQLLRSGAPPPATHHGRFAVRRHVVVACSGSGAGERSSSRCHAVRRHGRRGQSTGASRRARAPAVPAPPRTTLPRPLRHVPVACWAVASPSSVCTQGAPRPSGTTCRAGGPRLLVPGG